MKREHKLYKEILIDKLYAERSTSLFALARSNLTLEDFKTIDMYCGRINSRIPKERVVQITRKNYEILTNVKQVNAQKSKNGSIVLNRARTYFTARFHYSILLS